MKHKNLHQFYGRGVKGVINNTKYFAGNINFIKENNIALNEYENKSLELLNSGKTVLYFADENSIIGIIAVADTIKASTQKAIKEFSFIGEIGLMFLTVIEVLR